MLCSGIMSCVLEKKRVEAGDVPICIGVENPKLDSQSVQIGLTFASFLDPQNKVTVGGDPQLTSEMGMQIPSHHPVRY